MYRALDVIFIYIIMIIFNNKCQSAYVCGLSLPSSTRTRRIRFGKKRWISVYIYLPISGHIWDQENTSVPYTTRDLVRLLIRS